MPSESVNAMSVYVERSRADMATAIAWATLFISILSMVMADDAIDAASRANRTLDGMMCICEDAAHGDVAFIP